jgi:hypothetical protein
MLVGVMLAEQQFRARGQPDTHTRGCTTPVAPINPG